MTDDWRSELKLCLDPAMLLASVIAGLVAGILAVTFMFSYSAVIFTGELAGYVPRATGQMLFGAVVIALIVGLFSQFRGVVALPQDNPTAVIAVMIAALSQTQSGTADPETLFVQATVVMILSTVLAGIIFIAIGRWHLATLVHFIPYPVIAGFLAGTGWLLFKGSFSVMAGVALDLTDISALLGEFMLWGPGAAFAVIVLFGSQRFTHYLVMPGLILGAIALFHLVLLATGTGLQSAISQGWLLEPFGDGGLWQPIDIEAIGAIDWKVLVGEVTGLGTILVIAVISVLLNLTALESAFGRDIDVNREIRTTGYANLCAAAGGSLIGYHLVSLSTLGKRMKGDSRLIGVVVAAFCLFAMTMGADALSYVPRLVLGGLVMYIGLGFLNDWVVQTWSKLSRADVAIILAILVVIEVLGFLEGVAFGIAAAAILFIVNYSRIDVVRYALTGVDIQSNIDRPAEHRSRLIAEGEQILFLKLHGFIFFATTIGLIQTISDKLGERASRVKFVVLDFQHVTGIDTSALHGFVKIKQQAADSGVQLALTHVSSQIDRQFSAEKFLDGDAVIDLVFNDADHALEWCENSILREAGCEPELDIHPLADQLATIFETQADRETFALYIDSVEFAATDFLLHARDHERQLFLIESGELTVYVDKGDGEPYRLRRIGPGSLLGTAGFFRHGDGAALVSAQADTSGRAFALSASGFSRMTVEHPKLALAFQSFVLGQLSDLYANNLRVLEVVLRAEE
jgi:SulP family sulfate permease